MTKQEASPQRPELGIDTVVPAEPYRVSANNYPWIQGDAEVSTVMVTMIDGTQFRYGSIVGLNNTVSKIAGNVPKHASARAEESLFMALPFVLRGETHPSVDRVINQYDETTLLKVGKKGPDAARLFFEVQQDEKTELPVVLRVGVSSHKEQTKLHGIITTLDSSQRRKHDGGGR